MSLLHLLEPEETVGNAWHRLVGAGTSLSHYPDAAVAFDEIAVRLRVFFRGLGGDPGVELKPSVPEVSHHRLDRRLRLGLRAERLRRARYDGERFCLPDVIDVFPERTLNEALYYWLVAWTASGGLEAPGTARDPLARDVARIGHAARTTAAVLARFPGLAKRYDSLRRGALAQRPKRSLPPVEARIEALIGRVLSVDYCEPGVQGTGAKDDCESWPGSAPSGYRTYFPALLWGEIDAPSAREPRAGADEEPGAGRKPSGDGKSRRGRRRASDQINRKGGFFVHRFEKILTWTEFMNLHRNVEDDEEENARKAADDHDEIGIGELEKKAATRLVFDLDLSPADVDTERISDRYVYPEWDHRSQKYLASHVRVLERRGDFQSDSRWQPEPKAERRIRAVRRQFEALRPRRELLRRQLDGHEIDMDALIRSQADMKACGEGSDRVFSQAREEARDLSVGVLIDVSRSTESFVGNRTVIDIEREALVALSEGLDACGDEAALFAFSSLRRDRVFISKLKDFQERSGPAVRARIGALRPGFYTRLGAAIRHVSASLAERPSRKRLVLVLTDGKPNDVDHYEGRYGVEDTHKAVQEARRQGQAVFGITIDRRAQAYFPRIFGAAGFSVVSEPSRLTTALPVLYRHLVR